MVLCDCQEGHDVFDALRSVNMSGRPPCRPADNNTFACSSKMVPAMRPVWSRRLCVEFKGRAVLSYSDLMISSICRVNTGTSLHSA